LPAPPHPFRVGGGGGVERPRHRRPPVQQQRLVVVVAVEDADPPDVTPLARLGVEPAETQPAVGDVEALHLAGQRTYPGVAVHQRPAVLQIDRSPQRLAVPLLGAGAFGVQPCVEVGHIFPLGPQLVLPVVPPGVLVRRHTPPCVHDPPVTTRNSDCAPPPRPCRKPADPRYGGGSSVAVRFLVFAVQTRGSDPRCGLCGAGLFRPVSMLPEWNQAAPEVTVGLDIDMLDLRWRADGPPHGLFKRMRTEAPVYWYERPDGIGYWSV